MRALALLAVLALAGCGDRYTYRLSQDAAPSDPAIQTLCDPVPEPPARGSSMGKLYEFSNELVGLYGECALRDKAKADWIKSQGH